MALGSVYLHQYKLDKAEKMFGLATGRSDALVASGPSGVYKLQDRFGAAVKSYRQALESREAALGPGHPAVLAIVRDLASFYFRQSQQSSPDSRRALLEEAWQMNRRAFAASSVAGRVTLALAVLDDLHLALAALMNLEAAFQPVVELV
ncbi:hypothetical protein LQW54_005793 [Pestalotiopsis sp. IQ-011]